MANDDIVAKYKTQVDSSASTAPAGTGDFDVWMGGTQPFTGAMANIPVSLRKPGPENTMKASALQESILALNGSRDPRYDSIVGLLVNSNFLKKDYAKYPTYASQALGTSLEVYNAYVKNGGDKPFPEWLDWYSSTSVPIDDGSGRGGYTGPTTTTTYANERDLRSTADAIASEVLGRAVTEDEFQKVLKKVRTAEKEEPTVTTPSTGASVTEAGLTAEGRKSIIQEALMKGPEAREFGQATKMMDLFYSALNARPEGA